MDVAPGDKVMATSYSGKPHIHTVVSNTEHDGFHTIRVKSEKTNKSHDLNPRAPHEPVTVQTSDHPKAIRDAANGNPHAPGSELHGIYEEHYKRGRRDAKKSGLAPQGLHDFGDTQTMYASDKSVETKSDPNFPRYEAQMKARGRAYHDEATSQVMWNMATGKPENTNPHLKGTDEHAAWADGFSGAKLDAATGYDAAQALGRAKFLQQMNDEQILPNIDKTPEHRLQHARNEGRIAGLKDHAAGQTA